ncbi:MAG: hypothetical protein J6J13_06170 [Clostridia bacterium]|nr:hypothetical protein [Clostridia bacterium]
MKYVIISENGQHSDINAYIDALLSARMALRTAKDNNFIYEDLSEKRKVGIFTMKKTFSIILTFTMFFCLCACGKNSADIGSNETSLTEITASITSSNSSSENSSSETSSAKTSSVTVSNKTSSTASVSSSTVSETDYSNSTETITILLQDNVVHYKGKIITPYAILNGDYSVHQYYENGWECRRNISVYDSKLFFHDNISEKGQERNAIFTCDENGKNVKEVVKNTHAGVYTIYQGRIYYPWGNNENGKWERYIYSSNIDGTDEKKEVYLENISDIYVAVVKDSVIYFWAYENNELGIAKFDPKSKKFEMVKRYSDSSVRHRSELTLVGNDIYYHFDGAVYKVNFTGEDTVLPIATNESDTYLFNKTVAFCDQGVLVMNPLDKTANDPIDFFDFNDLSTKKEAPKSLYVTEKLNRIGHFYSFTTCQEKDKVILFAYDNP